MADLLTRSYDGDLATDGRTLSGRAFFWDVPSKVSDGGPAYHEAFTRGAAKKSISERTFPLGNQHPWAPNAKTDPTPLGPVHFTEGDDALYFEARLSKTRAADEMLELVNDKAMTGVSVGFFALKNLTRSGVTYRTEIKLSELSLVPTGMGAHVGSEVLAVRQEELDAVLGTPRLDALRARKLRAF